MKIRDQIKGNIFNKGFKISEVVDEINRRNNTNHSAANFSKKLSNETFRYSEVLQIADILGYDIVWVERK